MVYLLRPKLRRIIPLSNSIQRNQWKCHSASKSLFVIIFGTHLNIGTGYIADGKEPRLPPGMKKHLYEDMNKPFDLWRLRAPVTFLLDIMCCTSPVWNVALLVVLVLTNVAAHICYKAGYTQRRIFRLARLPFGTRGACYFQNAKMGAGHFQAGTNARFELSGKGNSFATHPNNRCYMHD